MSWEVWACTTIFALKGFFQLPRLICNSMARNIIWATKQGRRNACLIHLISYIILCEKIIESVVYLPQIIPTDHTVKFQKGFENRSSSLLQLRYFDLLRSLPEAGQHFVWLIQRFSGWLNGPFGSELWSYLYWGLKMNWKSWGKMYTVDFVCIY